MSKALPTYELPLFRSIKDFIQWVFAVEILLEKVEGADQTRITQMIKNSIVNKNDKRHIEAETDLKDIIDYMNQKYIFTEDLIGSSINHLIRLPDPETLQSSL